MPKKKEVKKEEGVPAPVENSAKVRYEFLLALYKTLQDEGIRSIGDLEVKISIAEKAL